MEQKLTIAESSFLILLLIGTAEVTKIKLIKAKLLKCRIIIIFNKLKMLGLLSKTEVSSDTQN